MRNGPKSLLPHNPSCVAAYRSGWEGQSTKPRNRGLVASKIGLGQGISALWIVGKLYTSGGLSVPQPMYNKYVIVF